MPFSPFFTTTTLLLTLTLTLTLIPLATPSPAPPPPQNHVSPWTTNLPPATPGTFTAQTRIIITTTVPAAWSALTNLALYPTWNPFTRSATLLAPLDRLLSTTTTTTTTDNDNDNNNNTPLSLLHVPPQYPTEGYRLLLRTQIPPLPLPVDRTTPDVLLNTRVSYENVTHVQRNLGRLAWAYYPELGLQAQRWQALSDVGPGLVLYESREVFSGPLAALVRDTMGPALQDAFDAQAKGLKLLLEDHAT